MGLGGRGAEVLQQEVRTLSLSLGACPRGHHQDHLVDVHTRIAGGAWECALPANSQRALMPPALCQVEEHSGKKEMLHYYYKQRGFPGSSVVNNPPANGGAAGLIPGSGRSPGGGNGNPLQYSCLEKPMDRGAWWATVHGVANSQIHFMTKPTPIWIECFENTDCSDIIIIIVVDVLSASLLLSWKQVFIECCCSLLGAVWKPCKHCSCFCGLSHVILTIAIWGRHYC